MGRFFHNALSARGIETLEPAPDTQAALMEYIYTIKKGGTADPAELRAFADTLREHGAETVILGCTELSVAAKDDTNAYIDALDILTLAAINYCKKGMTTP
jgi:aspartate racemase